MKNKAFTLIELLVVIAIIGLISSIVLVSLNRARANSRDTRRMSDLKQIQTAIELYYDDNGYYPKEDDGANGKVGEGAGLDTMLAPYMANVPADPNGPSDADYYYWYDGDHSCKNVIPDYNVSVLFAHTMEDSSKGNWATVCNGPGSSGSPQASTYMIVLGETSG